MMLGPTTEENLIPQAFIFTFCQNKADCKASKDLRTMLPKQIGIKNIPDLLATFCGEEK